MSDDARTHLMDSSAVRLDADEAERLYDELWLLVGAVRGALTAAAKVMEGLQKRNASDFVVVSLDANEAEVVRQLFASGTVGADRRPSRSRPAPDRPMTPAAARD
jgi:hypothetical protein